MSSSGKGTVRDRKGKENKHFHNALFREIKTWTVGGRTVKRRDVRKKINNGELPPLPPLKVDGQHMCLAWYTKGIYNPDSPRASDHVLIYLVEEYQPLCSWCIANYPKDERVLDMGNKQSILKQV